MGSTAQWNNLVTWLQKNGMKNALVECREFPETGRGLAVIRDTEPNEIIFTIPANCLLNADTIRGWSRKNSVVRLSSIQVLSAFLATYKGEGGSSKLIRFYTPYLDSLPEDFDFHPLTWTMEPRSIIMEQLHEALPPRVSKKLSDIRKRFMTDFSIVNSAIPTISIGNFLWGWLNVNTRSLYYKCRYANSQRDNITMCPLLDFANHSLLAPNFNAQAYRQQGHPIPSMIAPPDRGLQAGEQIFLLYGFHSNETSFTEYGFTDPDAPTEIHIDQIVERLFEDAKDGAEKSRLLKERGYWGDWTLHTEPPPAHPSYRLIPALRLFQLSMSDETMLRRWEHVIAGTLDEVSRANTELLRSTLATLCQQYHSESVAYLTESISVQNLPEPWQRQAMASIHLLWKEQRDVTALLMESIANGIEL